MIYVITRPFSTPDVSPFVSPEKSKMVKGVLDAVSKGACYIETYGILQATMNNLEEKAKSFVVTLDAKTFQPLRELRQQILQHINPKGN